MKQIYLSGVADFKLIFRDPSLRTFLGMPLLIFIVVLIAMPIIVSNYSFAADFVIVILAGGLVQTSIMFGFIYAMVLVHEKDLGVAQVYGIVPLPRSTFILGRMGAPTLLSTSISYLLLEIQWFYDINIGTRMILAGLSGLVAPMLTLAVANLSKTKMEAMTWFKFLNLVVAIPLLGLIFRTYSLWTSLIPTHFIFEVLYRATERLPYRMHLFVGLLYALLWLFFLMRYFVKNHFK